MKHCCTTCTGKEKSERQTFTKYGLVITSTWFKKPKRKFYTWRAPGDRNRYQRNYILMKHLFRNRMKEVKSLPGADIDFNHRLSVANNFPRWTKILRFRKGNQRWDLEKLYAQRTVLQAGRSRARYPLGSLVFLNDVILPPHYGSGVKSVSNRGKGSRCLGLTTLPPSCADCLEVLGASATGGFRASPVLYRD